MRYKKLTIYPEYLIVSLICLYYTLPISVQYIRFAGIIILYFAWFSCVSHRINNELIRLLFIISIWFVISIIIQLLVGDELITSIKTGFNQFLFLSPSLLYSHYSSRKNWKILKRILSISLFALLIGELNALFVLQLYPSASRVLASSSEDATLYAKMGAGTFGYIYAIALLLPCLIKAFLLIKRSHKNYKYSLLAIFVISCLVLLKASYTIALLLSAFGIVLMLCNKKWHYVIVSLLGLLCLIFVDRSVIGNLLINISGLFGSDTVLNKKFFDMSIYFLTGSMGDSTNGRYIVYSETIKSIKASPILGSLYSGSKGGGHTSWLDLYSQYGVISIFYYYILTKIIKHTYRTLYPKISSFYIIEVLLFFILGFLNPVHTQPYIGFVVLLLAPLLMTSTCNNQIM